MRYGLVRPAELVAQAVTYGQQLVGLTDRDGLYGAVQFAQACRSAGMPALLGVDLGLSAPKWGISAKPGVSARRSPVRGGAEIRAAHSRVVVYAQGSTHAWAQLCRLVSLAHSQGERNQPLLDREQVVEAVAEGGLLVMLGADSTIGQAVAAKRRDRAEAELRWWRQHCDPEQLRIEICTHRQADSNRRVVRSTTNAARMLNLAHAAGVTTVAGNAVRYLRPDQARVADVLDATRALVPLSASRIERTNTQAYFTDWAEQRQRLTEIVTAAGSASAAAEVQKLLSNTRKLAWQCALDPVRDIGIGEIHVPELDVLLDPARVVKPQVSSFQQRRRSTQAMSVDAVTGQRLLAQRCEAALIRRGLDTAPARQRLAAELDTIAQLQFASYFLTVAHIVDLVRDMKIRVAARGSGAGSFVNYLLGISGVNPLEYNLLMERFLSPLRASLPDIDIDVESARRTEVYEQILKRFGDDRCVCVSMRETYRVRHAIRDVGAALAFPPADIAAFAKSLPHIRATHIKSALADLPELRSSDIGRRAAAGELDYFLDLVAALDGLPRNIALHPCGVVLSDATLLDRTPVQASAQGFPMSHFDKDDVEDLGLLKLDVLGIRMQSAMQHAVAEIARVQQEHIDLDAVDLGDPATYELMRTTRTLGCFQIESPGQRELLGKLVPDCFNDVIVEISLFRPGPVKSDMITPFLRARHGFDSPQYLHPDLRGALAETSGVVVYHEQVLRVVATITGCSLAYADEIRRDLGKADEIDRIRGWFYRCAQQRGYQLDTVEQIWQVLRAFASFGFCKAHATAFALPTFQSTWLKAHYPAAFFAGVLTHDPGMYPKRLILADLRNFGIEVAGVDVNRSTGQYQVEAGVNGQAVRVPLSEVKGISEQEVTQIIAAAPYHDLWDFWQRARVSIPVVENLIVAGGFDSLYGIGIPGARASTTRRELLLQLADFSRGGKQQASSQQLSLTLDEVATAGTSGLVEFSMAEKVHAELSVLGLDVSSHLVSFYERMLRELPTVPATELGQRRSQSEVLVAGVKVATQTPPIRTGQRVIFLTLDDGSGPIDITFFPDVQVDYATTVFGSWLLLVRGVIRKTGQRGLSLRATGCWDLLQIHELFTSQGRVAVHQFLAGQPRPEKRTPIPVGTIFAHVSGMRTSPYADVLPANPASAAPTKLWHSSPGSSGW